MLVVVLICIMEHVYFDCDDSTTYQCPVIQLGDYSVWYSSINDSGDRNNTGGN